MPPWCAVSLLSRQWHRTGSPLLALKPPCPMFCPSLVNGPDRHHHVSPGCHQSLLVSAWPALQPPKIRHVAICADSKRGDQPLPPAQSRGRDMQRALLLFIAPQPKQLERAARGVWSRTVPEPPFISLTARSTIGPESPAPSAQDQTRRLRRPL